MMTPEPQNSCVISPVPENSSVMAPELTKLNIKNSDMKSAKLPDLITRPKTHQKQNFY